MAFHSFARGIDVGAHCYLVELEGARVLLDAGTHPKRAGLETLPDLDAIPFEAIDGILVSHAHLDHIGALPVLCREFPDAPVYATEETLAIGEAMLHNSVNVMKAQRRELGIGAYPLYTHDEIDDLVPGWIPRRFGQRFALGATGAVTASFLPAGHVLGAAGVVLRNAGRTVVYTGDVHFEDQSLCPAADFEAIAGETIDTMIIETTRGEHDREAGYTREIETDRLVSTIRETLEQGGTVMLPVFAFGKTQELLILLHEARGRGELPRVPIHIGGLSTKITKLFDRFASSARRRHRNLRLLEDLPDLVIPSRKQKLPYVKPGEIYAVSSGMMSENTVSNRLAQYVLPHPENALLFIGYADPETPGGRILATEPGEMVSMNDRGSGRRLPLECRVEKFDFSGHAPRDQLLDFILRTDPKHAILVHGDEPAREWFANRLREQRPEMRVTVPRPGEPVGL